MAPSRTKTIKNKHANAKSTSGALGKRSAGEGVSKSRKSKGLVQPQQVKEKNRALLLKRPKKRKYTDDELGIPKLNMITPVGVIKPKGKKKGKVFVDDRESMHTILSMVQAEKDGQIESKMIKARQMEEIREARKIEMEKKESERQAKLEDVKNSLKKQRKRKANDEDAETLKTVTSAGTKASKPRKSVSFAG